MTINTKTKFNPYVVDCFKEIPFYKKHIKKPKIKHLKTSFCFLSFLFMKKLNIIKTNHAFRDMQ